MVSKNLEFTRFDTLEDLYNKLMTIELLKDKMQIDSEKIQVKFHNDFVLTIKLESYFNVYLNNFFYNNIESQDIWESMHEIIDDKAIFVESNGSFKKKISIIDQEQFEKRKEKLICKQNIKIFTLKEVLYQS